MQLDSKPAFLHSEFNIEPYIKQHLRVKLDADDQLCILYQSNSCPLGPTCPQRHVQASPLNFLPPQPIPQSAHARTVCKHWLRGLCKKGATCDFMHEYNLRKMPECWFFAKYGFCSNGDEVRNSASVLSNGPPRLFASFPRLALFLLLTHHSHLVTVHVPSRNRRYADTRVSTVPQRVLSSR